MGTKKICPMEMNESVFLDNSGEEEAQKWGNKNEHGWSERGKKKKKKKEKQCARTGTLNPNP